MAKPQTTLVLFVLAAGAAVAAWRANRSSAAPPERPEVEATIPTTTVPGAPTALHVPDPPPTPDEARETLARIFGAALVAAPKDGLLAGDFDGDESADIVVAARPAAGGLDALNADLANWTRVDARPVAPPPGHPPLAVRVAPDDLVLAVVQGYGGQGWRNASARQAYVVRGAAGAPLSRRGRETVPVAVARKLQLQGDVIATRIAGKDGFLYWSGGRYTWYAPPS